MRHQAVSGYWHSLATLARWCRLRSYLDAAAAHGIAALDAISSALAGKPWLPPLPAIDLRQFTAPREWTLGEDQHVARAVAAQRACEPHQRCPMSMNDQQIIWKLPNMPGVASALPATREPEPNIGAKLAGDICQEAIGMQASEGPARHATRSWRQRSGAAEKPRPVQHMLRKAALLAVAVAASAGLAAAAHSAAPHHALASYSPGNFKSV